MSAASIVTLIGVGVAVAAVAIYLTIVALKLRHTSFVVGTVLIGVRAIALQTKPIGDVVKGIHDDVTAVESALRGLVTGGELGEAEATQQRRRRRALRSGR